MRRDIPRDFFLALVPVDRRTHARHEFFASIACDPEPLAARSLLCGTTPVLMRWASLRRHQIGGRDSRCGRPGDCDLELAEVPSGSRLPTYSLAEAAPARFFPALLCEIVNGRHSRAVSVARKCHEGSGAPCGCEAHARPNFFRCCPYIARLNGSKEEQMSEANQAVAGWHRHHRPVR
jgi:hypothetical protein